MSLFLTGSGCSLLSRFPETTPVRRTIVTRPAVERDMAAHPDPGTLESIAVPRRDEAPTLVDAQETLRLYQKNILLVGEALLTLELMERGALDESERRIHALAGLYPDRESALLIRTLLNHWLSRARTISGASPDQVAPEIHVAAPAEPPANTEKAVASLKMEGLNFYSRGDLDGAVSCWRRILELDPADTETRKFLQRAEAILRNRRAG